MTISVIAPTLSHQPISDHWPLDNAQPYPMVSPLWAQTRWSLRDLVTFTVELLTQNCFSRFVSLSISSCIH